MWTRDREKQKMEVIAFVRVVGLCLSLLIISFNMILMGVGAIKANMNMKHQMECCLLQNICVLFMRL